MTASVLIVALGAVALGGLAILLHALLTAPIGYEDQAGFHVGNPAVELGDDNGCGNPS